VSFVCLHYLLDASKALDLGVTLAFATSMFLPDEWTTLAEATTLRCSASHRLDPVISAVVRNVESDSMSSGDQFVILTYRLFGIVRGDAGLLRR
jgi:hypothetical protein